MGYVSTNCAAYYVTKRLGDAVEDGECFSGRVRIGSGRRYARYIN